MALDREKLRAHVEASQDMTADEAAGASKLSALLRGTRDVVHTKIPGTQLGLVIRPLMGGEKQECLGDASKRFTDLGIPPEMKGYQDFEDEICWQILARVMRDPDTPGDDRNPWPVPFAKDVDEVRSLMTVDERDVIMTEFLDLEERCDPDPALMPELWHDQIEATLKKSSEPGASSLADLLNFGSRALSSYLLATADRLLNSPTPKSTSGQQSGTQSSETLQ